MTPKSSPSSSSLAYADQNFKKIHNSIESSPKNAIKMLAKKCGQLVATSFNIFIFLLEWSVRVVQNEGQPRVENTVESHTSMEAMPKDMFGVHRFPEW